MPDVTIKFKDGTTRRFEERGRAGGSWRQTVRYEGVFVLIVDEWGGVTAFPAQDIAELSVAQDRRGGW